MLSCLRGSDSLPPGQSLSSECGAPLQMLLDQPRIVQMNVARQLGLVAPTSASSTFYIPPHLLTGEVMEEDSFFEDMTALYRRQAILFQKTKDQVRDVYRVDLPLASKQPGNSLFGEVAKEGGEKLYSQVLFCLLHPLGADFKQEKKFELLEHLRKAFQIEPARHLQLYNEASQLPSPDLRLSLQVVAARNLHSKDIGGSANPYCSLHIAHSSGNPQVTSCRQHTLDPEWGETFTLKLEDSKSSRLQVIVWDSSPSSSSGVVGKLKRAGEVKDTKGLRTLITDTVTAAQGDKILGKLELPLQSLPASGEDKWWRLERESGRAAGELRLALHLFTRDGQLVEHQRLLRVLLSRELVQRQPLPHAWRDNFSGEALQILAQHAVQARMSRVETALTRLLVYTDLHLLLPLDCRVFPPILQKLRGPVLQGSISSTLVAKFHSAARRLATSFTSYIREMRRHLGGSEARHRLQLEAILASLHLLHTCQWRTRNDIVLQVEDALLAGLREWFAFVLERVPKDERVGKEKEGGREERMRNLTRITHLLVADLEEGKRLYQDTFRKSLNINYLELAFNEFDANIKSITKEIIDEVQMAQIQMPVFTHPIVFYMGRVYASQQHCDELYSGEFSRTKCGTFLNSFHYWHRIHPHHQHGQNHPPYYYWALE